MLWILSFIIIVYIASYLLFGRKEVFLKVRKWIDISTLIVVSVLVIAWIEVFHYSFYFIIYFLLSISLIVYLIVRLRKLEIKKKNAETTIKVLKDEEELLKEELQNEKNINS